MRTDNTVHLGDGAYAGLDPNGIPQFWLGANHHENMSVALGPSELAVLLKWLERHAPHILLPAIGPLIADQNRNANGFCCTGGQDDA